MAEIVSQVPSAAAQSSGFSIMHFILFGILALFAWVIWKAFKSNKEEELKLNRYREALDMIREHALLMADDKYFSSWFRPSKNAQVNRQFQWEETGKIRNEPLLGVSSRYMGHYQDSKGNFIIAICTGKEYLVMPIVEVILVPGSLVHMQDDGIIVNCVSVEKKSHNMPYWPVVKGKDGHIIKADFYHVNDFWQEMVSTQVIENQGNQFVESMDKVTKVNPHVAIKRKTRGTDGGI